MNRVLVALLISVNLSVNAGAMDLFKEKSNSGTLISVEPKHPAFARPP